MYTIKEKLIDSTFSQHHLCNNVRPETIILVHQMFTVIQNMRNGAKQGLREGLNAKSGVRAFVKTLSNKNELFRTVNFGAVKSKSLCLSYV